MRKNHNLFICLFLILSTLFVYWQVKDHDFVYYDDDKYVSENPHVQAGLTVEGIVWAFTTRQSSNWHPVTWLSHMLDTELFGANPGRHHLVNLFLHILNTLLLFAVFRKMTGATWQSGIVAALFALHPLHVESVAWIAERKDVLSTFFWMLTIWAYARYADRQTIGSYLPVCLFLVLGLLSKPMLVTLPFVLLLLDYWPLNRYGTTACDLSGGMRRRLLQLVREKAPFFAFSLVSSSITYLVQQQSGALRPLEAVPFGIRLANASISYMSYIGKIFWPARLAVLYPYPSVLDWWVAAGALLLLAAASVLAVRLARQRPYAAVGWFWYVGTLVPVIGLVQVGTQAMADRYTYVPSIGLFVLITWAVAELRSILPRPRIVFPIVTAAAVLPLMAVTLNQVRYWRNTATLFEHTLAVTADNWLPHFNLGYFLEKQGQADAAISHYREAVRINPDYEPALNNLGLVLEAKGRLEEALRYYTAALQLNPDYEKAHNNLALALEKVGRIDEAIAHYQKAVRLKPDYEKARNNLGLALEKEGRLDEAIEQFREAVRIRPDYEKAHFNLANSLHKKELFDEAIVHYLTAVRVSPDYVPARNNLGIALYRKGNIDGAIEQFREVLRISPTNANARNNLKRLLAIQRERP